MLPYEERTDRRDAGPYKGYRLPWVADNPVGRGLVSRRNTRLWQTTNEFIILKNLRREQAPALQFSKKHFSKIFGDP